MLLQVHQPLYYANSSLLAFAKQDPTILGIALHYHYPPVFDRKINIRNA